ncbi:MAG: zinc-dependent metalloprotease family protein [Methylotetracoccus sp.]
MHRPGPPSRRVPGAVLAAVVLLLALLPLSDRVASAAPPAGQRAFPRITLPHAARGEEALQLLGSSLPEVAAWYGKTPEQFVELLRRDESAVIDSDGRLLYIDDFPTHPPVGDEVGPRSRAQPEAAPFPYADTFRLHSRPGAQRTIYMDFDGHTVTGTQWNKDSGLDTINAPAFDIDGNAAAFSENELLRIQLAWQRAAEDYAPFDVDVTTEDPGAAALERSSANDAAFGSRAVITRLFKNSAGKNFCNCGGIAYIGVFNEVGGAYHQPAWVFYDQLGGGDEKDIGEATAHEVGHNLGLSHDGAEVNGTHVEYYAGHGVGDTAWAPIMGVGYYRNLTQWSQGEYPNANNQEDDIQIIQNHEAPLRADDHVPVAPLGLTGGTSIMEFVGSGVIERRTDVDYFSLPCNGADLTISVLPADPGPNLDVALDLLDRTFAPLGGVNPPNQLSATLPWSNTPSGNCILKVQGIDRPGPAASDAGYSDYGSLGQYHISVQSVPQIQKLRAASVVNELLLSDDNYQLVVRRSGKGTVRSAPAGIACGKDCNNDFPDYGVVKLVAKPAAGWKFDHWGAACKNATTNVCKVKLTKNSLVNAYFTVQ